MLTSTSVTSGASSANSSPTVPCAAATTGSSKGCTSVAPGDHQLVHAARTPTPCRGPAARRHRPRGGLDRARGCRLRHDDGGGHAELAGRVGQRHAVVAAAHPDHAGGPLGVGQPEDLRERPARLEGTGALQQLQLHRDRHAESADSPGEGSVGVRSTCPSMTAAAARRSSRVRSSPTGPPYARRDEVVVIAADRSPQLRLDAAPTGRQTSGTTSGAPMRARVGGLVVGHALALPLRLDPLAVVLDLALDLLLAPAQHRRHQLRGLLDRRRARGRTSRSRSGCGGPACRRGAGRPRARPRRRPRRAGSPRRPRSGSPSVGSSATSVEHLVDQRAVAAEQVLDPRLVQRRSVWASTWREFFSAA